MKEKLTKIVEKDGFYFILFICVCIVAITAVMTSKDNLDELDNLSKSGEEDLVILENDIESEESIEIAKMEGERAKEAIEDTDEIETKEDETEDVTETEEEQTEEPQIEESSEKEAKVEETVAISESYSSSTELVVPVIGKIGTDYTENNLVYSETLEKWIPHKGLDIIAEEGTQVMASLSGTVQEVYDDPLWGTIVIINHGDNLQTKYANLSEEVLVKEGAKVNKGDVIGRIGKTADIEMMEEAHIHFEVIENGISVNPNDYLPSFIHSN